jgi:hypothetical protein
MSLVREALPQVTSQDLIDIFGLYPSLSGLLQKLALLFPKLERFS